MAQGHVQKLTANNYRERVEGAMATGQGFFFNQVMESDIHHQNGESRSIRQVIFPIRRANEQWIGCIVQDYDEVKKNQRDVVNGQARLKAILDNVQTGILIVDPSNHSIVDVNPAAVRMFGAPRESIIGSVCHNFICPADVGKCPVTDLGQTIECSERALMHNDRSRSPIIKTVTTFFLDGRPLLLESFVDITERKQMEEKLRTSEELLRLLASNLKDMIYLVDIVPKVKFMYISSAVGSLLGYSAQEVQRMENPLALIHPDDLVGFQELIFGPKKKWLFESKFRMRLKRKDGEYVWIDARNTPIVGEDGELQSIEGSARDISAEVRVEQELERNSRADKMINTLSTEIANLRTSEIDPGVLRVLEKIGEFVKSSRCSVCSSESDDGTLELTHSWTALGAVAKPICPDKLLSDNPGIVASLQAGEVLQIQDLKGVPSPGQGCPASSDGQGIGTMVIVPSSSGGVLQGYIAFESGERNVKWDSNDVRMLNIVGKMINSVLRRKRAEELLNAERERFAITMGSIGDGVISTDRSGNIILGNRMAEEMTGMNRYSMVGLHIKEVLGLPDRE